MAIIMIMRESQCGGLTIRPQQLPRVISLKTRNKCNWTMTTIVCHEDCSENSAWRWLSGSESPWSWDAMRCACVCLNLNLFVLSPTNQSSPTWQDISITIAHAFAMCHNLILLLLLLLWLVLLLLLLSWCSSPVVASVENTFVILRRGLWILSSLPQIRALKKYQPQLQLGFTVASICH